jgi:site-specific recombinase XerD
VSRGYHPSSENNSPEYCAKWRSPYAAFLFHKGLYPKVGQEMLEHSSITITLDTYSHVLPNMQKEAVKAMEELID